MRSGWLQFLRICMSTLLSVATDAPACRGLPVFVSALCKVWGRGAGVWGAQGIGGAQGTGSRGGYGAPPHFRSNCHRKAGNRVAGPLLSPWSPRVGENRPPQNPRFRGSLSSYVQGLVAQLVVELLLFFRHISVQDYLLLGRQASLDVRLDAAQQKWPGMRGSGRVGRCGQGGGVGGRAHPTQNPWPSLENGVQLGHHPVALLLGQDLLVPALLADRRKVKP